MQQRIAVRVFVTSHLTFSRVDVIVDVHRPWPPDRQRTRLVDRQLAFPVAHGASFVGPHVLVTVFVGQHFYCASALASWTGCIHCSVRCWNTIRLVKYFLPVTKHTFSSLHSMSISQMSITGTSARVVVDSGTMYMNLAIVVISQSIRQTSSVHTS